MRWRVVTFVSSPVHLFVFCNDVNFRDMTTDIAYITAIDFDQFFSLVSRVKLKLLPICQ